jgi:hypothetical protein
MTAVDSVPSIEQQLKVFKAALCEAGYPHVPVYRSDKPKRRPYASCDRTLIPPAVFWTAQNIALGPLAQRACWSCWFYGHETGDWTQRDHCRAGECAHPEGPARPPRELLAPPPTPWPPLSRKDTD